MDNVTVVPGMSDHDVVTFSISETSTRNVFIFKKTNNDAIKPDLEEFSDKFMNDYEQHNVEENWIRFTNAIKETINKNIHQKLFKTTNNLPWWKNHLCK